MTKANKGIYAASLTPVGPDGEPDGHKLARYCRWNLEQGLDGVAPLGTTGEGNSLPLSFRTALPAIFAEAGFKPSEVIFGTGACATGDAIAATKAATDAGFFNVLVLPPFYFKNVSDEGLFAYYARLIEGVGDDRLRVYLYHFPQMSMTPISIDLIQRLKRAFGPLIAGLKDSSGDFGGTLEFVDAADDFDVFPSNESVLLEGLGKGCAGVISATTNASAALARATLSSAGEEAAALQETLTAVRVAISRHPLSAALKQIEAWRTGDDSWLPVFAPQVGLTQEQKQQLRQDLEALEPASGVLSRGRAAA
ncbi:dihydrodipicolinate synthase family protein [Hoeflea poritis]|uniref:Dihydrodipicolinate synthase family protein n=1 Tax=Hoeflea poritis TaxID=2993659 RepID=A0ABT4VMC6_9HYPH|nr:dihydrodipicolinate synthase family protein [Hoeflea poritis]MDA4845272.1 dihydrodipicolinate synthase family protein [Hoeflea poritis]